jgi:VCBS repeat-containing protein
VTINVAPVNDPPVVTVADIVVDEDGSAVGVVTATDVDGDPLSYVVSTLPTKGEVSAIDPETGVFTYTPFDNLNGTDTFSVTVGDTTVEVTVTVDVAIAAVADAPVAEDAVVPTDEDIAVSSTLIATDADEGDVLTFVLVTGATNGTAVVDPDGSFTYTPAADFNGTDTFTFKANDGDPTYLDSNTATITITVAADNDAPVAVDADYQVFENTPLAGALVASDVDGDPLTYSVATPPSFGGVTIDPATGAFTYTPNDRYLGGDSFTFTATDTSDATGTGLITINVIDPVPNWNFIGFDTPWRPNYKVNAGSAIPLKWTYTDPDTGAVVDSSMAEPEIRITAYVPCNSTGDPLTWIEDPGSSDLRYFDGDWQFNWDTVDLDAGCYFLSIYHPTTDQLDDVSEDGDPLRIELK